MTWWAALASRRGSRRMWAAREALGTRPEHGDSGLQNTFTSPVMCGGQPAVRISLPVAGLDELFLYVTGAPEVVYGAATWADAKLVDGKGNETRVCHIEGLKVLEGRHDIDRNLESGVSGPLRIAGQQYEHGIHVYAPSKIRIPLEGKYARFESWIGIDDWVGAHGGVLFHVTDRAGAARLDLWTRLANEFTDERSRRQMKWEREDRILDGNWVPGDYAEIAKRYARASFRIQAVQLQAVEKARHVVSRESLQDVRRLYHRSRELDACLDRAKQLPIHKLQLAVKDLIASFAGDYPQGPTYLKRLDTLRAIA